MDVVSSSISDGVTASERYLARLCRLSFLRLWSWPNLFRDQRTGPKSQGKEVCDLLAVFDRHVFLFSDKYCAFPNTGNLKTDWSRWFKRAVWKGAEQIWGAERWIKQQPDRLFCDPACKVRLPVNLPPAKDVIFHRIVVSHGAGERCRKQFGGTGSLMLDPSIVGRRHFEPVADVEPFTIGTLDPARGVVHVMDDFTLDAVLRTVDTVSDLAAYLEAKEELVTSGRLVHAAGEEELLAHYLKNADDAGRHIFALPGEATHFSVGEGIWESFEKRPERLAQIEANEISYTWDRLIDEFAKHMLGGTQYFGSEHSVAELELALRIMAMENRTERRMLASALLDAMKRGHENDRFSRVVQGQTGSSRERPRYIFMTLKRPSHKSPEQYRLARRNFLEAHCVVLRGLDPSAKHIIGIALGPFREPGSKEPWFGEDLIYLDGTDWDATLQADAERLRRDLRIFVNVRGFEVTDHEYPRQATIQPPTINYSKGRHRNRPCPCGSGKKAKNCQHGSG